MLIVQSFSLIAIGSVMCRTIQLADYPGHCCILNYYCYRITYEYKDSVKLTYTLNYD